MEADAKSSPAVRKRRAARAYFVLGTLAALAVGIYFIHGYLTRDEISTDNAQVDADVVPVAALSGGVIAKVVVQDNQHVTAGQLIAELDPSELTARRNAAAAELAAATAQADVADTQVELVRTTSSGGLSSARAQVQGSSASVRSAAAQVAAAGATLARAKAELAKAESDYADAVKLNKLGAVSGQQLEIARTTRDTAKASVDAAQANLAAAREQQQLSRSRVAEAEGRLAQSAPVDRQVAAAEAAARLAHARVDAAKAQLALAELQFNHIRIIAPAAGYVSKLAVHPGQLVQQGSTVLMLVPETPYVVANFKETQIARLRPDDPCEIEVDALDRTLHGKVISVSPGTGARFSLLPPDNATGNFVKVVQRVPVKIAFDPGQDLTGLRAGLSAEVEVHLQH